jgi:hypothetical protein
MAKENFYIVWIEGLTVRRGEKIFSLSDDQPRYTTSMVEAMRIRERDIPAMKEWMEENEFASWVIDSPNTFIRTSYVPKGTLYKF